MYYDNRPTLERAVELAVLENVRAGNSFTWHDIFEQLENQDDVPFWKVSSYVQDLFNKRHSVFDGYACYPARTGPTVFFSAKKIPIEIRLGTENKKGDVKS